MAGKIECVRHPIGEKRFTFSHGILYVIVTAVIIGQKEIQNLKFAIRDE